MARMSGLLYDGNNINGIYEQDNLDFGENEVTIDAGLTENDVPEQTASLGDRVFLDANSNGIQDAGEMSVPGVPITVEDRNGIVQTTASNSNGIYTVDGLAPGDYKITVDAPNGFEFSPVDRGTNDSADSDVNPNTGMSDFVTLDAGENDPTIDIGLIAADVPEQTASMGERVSNDANGNGIQDAGFLAEPPEEADVDLSVTMTARGVNSNKAKIQASGTLKHTITVTNNSNETATGVVVGTDLQVAMDVWEPGQTLTEYGTNWVNASTAEKREDRFFGNPETVDSTNGTVTVNDVPMAGIAPEKSDIDIETLDRGELIWELGTPLAPGETATLSFHGQRTFEKVGGVDFNQTASLINVDQRDINPANNQQVVAIKFETPIALDLNGDGIQTLSIDEGVEFDLLNSGVKVNTGWLSGEDALLAVDNNGNGKIDDRSELFGGDVGEGFAKLGTFDSNDDGLVNADDTDFGLLQVWQDANENGVTDANELVSLESTSIAALNTDYTNVFEMDAQGNIHGETSSATLTDGSNIDMVDVYFQVQA